MTAIDLIIIGVTVYALLSVVGSSTSSPARWANADQGFVLTGLLVLGGFYATDLFSMYGLAFFVPMDVAMAFMQRLHLDYSWLVFGFSIVLIVIGFSRINRSSLKMIADIEASRLHIINHENRMRTVIDTVIDGIITFDKNGIIESFNPAAERIFGYSAEDVIGQNFSSLMPKPYCQEHDGYLTNYLSTDVARVIGIGREVTGLRRDGSTFPMDLAVGEMEIGGARVFTGVVRDVTERHEADRLKTEFISTVSHELRTPLTSIQGSLGLIDSGVIGDIPAEALNMVGIANRNCGRLVRLINDILDIEKIEAGEMSFEIGVWNLPDLVGQAIEANKAYSDKYGVSVMFDNASGDVSIPVDQDRFAQVMANLISNAAKFSNQGGTVRIATERRNGVVRVSVSDNGPGIAEEFHDRLFAKFTQEDSSDTRAKEGTGLGLAICKAIVERMAGQIGFETGVGCGTTFYFDLPAADAPCRPCRAATPVSDFLIVEDDPDIAKVIDAMLINMGHRCDIMHTIADARRALAEKRYAAMTLDIGLPDGNGLTMIRELRAAAETRDLPIVVLSAQSKESQSEINGAAVMVIDWLTKPIDHERLKAAVVEALSKSNGGRKQVLHVEDDTDVAIVTATALRELADLTQAESVAAARHLLGEQWFDLVILDLKLPDGNGYQLLGSIEAIAGRPVPVVIFSVNAVSKTVADQVVGALVKSESTMEQLSRTIRMAFPGNGPPAAAG